MIITIAHPDLGPQTTRLSADVAAAATSSTVENNTGFATNDYTVFGTLGEELTEIVKLTSTTGNTTLGHTTGPVFAHAARTTISEIKYNQVKIYSATSEDGTYSLVTTIDLDVDQYATLYDDTTGTSSTWYKVKYYNETTTSLSSFSDAIQGTGFTQDSLGSMADEVMEDFGDSGGKDLSREQVYNYLRAGVRRLTSELIKMFPDYRKNFTTLTLSSGVSALPTRFLGLIRVDAGSTQAGAYKAEYVNEGALEAGTTYSAFSPKAYIRGSNLYIQPTDITYAYVWYWDYPADMDSEADEHGLPYGARDVLVAYALYRAWMSKDIERASAHKSMFKEASDIFMEMVASSRQNITKDYVQLTSGAELYDYR